MTQLLDWFEGSEQPRQRPCEASPEILSNVDVVPAFQDRPLFSTRGAVRSNRTMWISGPITTVHNVRICHELAAVARVGLATRRWLSDKSRSAAVVLGNHPMSVRIAERHITSCESVKSLEETSLMRSA